MGNFRSQVNFKKKKKKKTPDNMAGKLPENAITEGLNIPPMVPY